MAKKTYCDACGGEVTIAHISSTMSLPVHITSGKGSSGYDVAITPGKHHEPISGRYDNYDLCIVCANKINTSAWNKFMSIKTQSNKNKSK